ncbi:MAG: glycine betaine ABC transporter substrate-binding protein [Bacillota bacterium]|nr:glycine betaine ABC transporter substrate-binding protein [Bacillota bacterium]
MTLKRFALFCLIALMIAGLFFVAGCQPEDETVDVTVVVGSKEFTESLILSQLAILALEDKGFTVVDETGLGGTVIAREALEAGEIDLYWEYTGTALVNYFGFDVITDPEECYQLVKATDLEQNGLVWLDYTQYNNTYVIMMRQADAEALGIASISDLAAAINEGVDAPDPGSWIFGSNHEYSTRDDGFPGLLEHYGFEFDSVDVMDYGILYTALRDGDLACAMGFGTDGRITPFNLVILEDDQYFHPVYNSSPVIRQDKLEEAPQIADILNPIASALDNENMSNLNRLVDEEDYLPEEVAEEWLREQGFIN